MAERGDHHRAEVFSEPPGDSICILACFCYWHVTFPAEGQLDGNRISVCFVLCSTWSGT